MDPVFNILCVVPVNVHERLPHTQEIEYTPTPGMVHTPCEKCGLICWVGPKQLAAKRSNPETPIWCMNCLFRQAEEWKAQGEELSGHVRNLSNE